MRGGKLMDSDRNKEEETGCSDRNEDEEEVPYSDLIQDMSTWNAL